jgi:prevent-host-death family protein
MKWQLQAAKNRFSELVRAAQRGKPQLVTKNGEPVVYVVDYAQYRERMHAQEHDKKSILLARPHKDIELSIDRDEDYGREVEL